MVCPWGGDKIAKIRGVVPPDGKRYGMCREACAYRNAENIINGGEYDGKTLRYIIDNYHNEFLGDDSSDQIVRVCYIDAAETLSIQVHPSEEYARKVGDFEKSESWYIVECGEGANLVAGTTTDDIGILKKASEEGRISQFVKRMPVQKGDFVMIPAGMLHACGGNILALEIGGFGGITYRIDDFGRGRPTNIKEGFQVINPSLSTEVQHFGGSISVNSGYKIYSATCNKDFSVDVVDIADKWVVKKGDYYVILTVVDGSAVVLAERECYLLLYTHSIILPASIKSFTVKGKCRLILSYRMI